MELTGEQLIPASRQAVWDALNDPEALKACIPGCQELVATGDDGFEATVQAKVGPVKAKFKGAVTLSNIDAPNGYTISGEGKGGAAGFAKGGAKVRLEDDGAPVALREIGAWACDRAGDDVCASQQAYRATVEGSTTAPALLRRLLAEGRVPTHLVPVAEGALNGLP